MQQFICQKLLVCAAKIVGLHLQQVDMSKLKLAQVRPLADGGFILVLDPITLAK